ncbi:MAG: non-ribosomal peptide synthetase [Chloroflexi bacterium]|nr:non-ribosomal peptide synthetase [Chloroflexota bacterium]
MVGLSLDQQAIRDKCCHPSGTFVEFKKQYIKQSISSRFEEQVRQYPDRLAIKTITQELTYEELNNAANQVARAILARRGECQETVALLSHLGAPIIGAILGASKAGKTYVPLDPSFPIARTAYILEDSRAGLLVTDTQNLPLAREVAQQGCEIINIDDLALDAPVENPDLDISPEFPCWIIYTSGSTGRPKGVIQTHRNVLHMTMNYTNNFHVCADDRVSLLFSCSVHAGAFSTFMALLNGAGLYALDLKTARLDQLAEWLTQQEITVCGFVPTLFRQFADTLAGNDQFPKLRLIYLAGEPVYKRDVELYTKHFSQDCIFVNRLGSTETDVMSMYFVDKKTQISGTNVPAGYAPQDKQVLLLSDEGQEVGINQIGEIAVRSRYLSPGYWNKPEVTQAVFLQDPDEGKERIYRTGDMGRMLPDGCLEHLGRKDFQVKIRGYRVEVAEIEMALLELTSIGEAAVVAREDTAGDQRLVAYLVPATEPAPSIGELRSHLNEKLPDYMVPSAFVFLDALPTLPNGKLDRRGLPPPGSARPALDNDYLAPRTAVETTLVRIWSEVLGLDQVGVHDNFLELGGDSLLAGQVISRVIGIFRVELPLRSLFEAPTVADMAVAIKGTTNSGTERRIPAISRVARNAYRVSMPPPGTLGGHEVSD